MKRSSLLGILSLLFVGFAIAASGVIIKSLSDILNSYQIVEYRFLFAFLLAALGSIILKEKVILAGLDKKLLFFYATLFPICILLFTLSVSYGSVALTIMSAYGANLVTSFILAQFFFGEKISKRKATALLLVFLALFLITKPWSSFAVSESLLFGLLSGIFLGISNMLQKKLGSLNADRSSLLLLQSFAGTALASMLIIFTGDSLIAQMSSFDWFLSILLGLALVAIIYFFVYGFKHTNLNTGSILVSSQLFFAPALAFIFLGEAVTIEVVVAAMLVFLAALIANTSEENFPLPF